MTINREDQLDGLKHIGRIVARTLEAMRNAAEPGMTTAELDAIGAELMALEGAQSAPKLTYGFPGATCISVFPAIAHGIPGSRRLVAGQLINIEDVGHGGATPPGAAGSDGSSGGSGRSLAGPATGPQARSREGNPKKARWKKD